MIGSANHVFFSYDGDDSDKDGRGAWSGGFGADREDVRGVLRVTWAAVQGHRLQRALGLRPVHRREGSVGGLFTGAEGIKTPQEAAIWGGTAGQPYDPGYHQACDTYANNNDGALAANSDAVAYATLSYGRSTNLINGTKSKGNFRPPPVPVGRSRACESDS